MKTATRLIERFSETLLVVLMSTMVLDVSWQVFTRFVLARPSSFTEEMATFLLIWIGLLGAAHAYRHKAHLAIDLLAARLTGRRRAVLDVVGHMCVIAFALSVLLVGGLRLVFLTFELHQTSASIGLPIGFVYLVLPLSGSLIVWYGILFLQESWPGRTEKDPAPAVAPDLNE